jgi:hypothetical protein
VRLWLGDADDLEAVGKVERVTVQCVVTTVINLAALDSVQRAILNLTPGSQG